MNSLSPDSATPESAQDTAAISSPDFELAAELAVDLYCPNCEYNLTGLTENRCPECGQEFDPDDVAERCSLLPRFVPAWPMSEAATPIRGYVALIVATWFFPKRFGKDFPLTHLATQAWGFSLLNKALTVAMIQIAIVLSSLMQESGVFDLAQMLFFGILIAIVVAALGPMACELLLALVLAWLVRPKLNPRARRFHFWLGITQYTSSFTIAMTLFYLVFYLLAEALSLNYGMNLAAVLLSLGIAAIWWWHSLSAIIYARGEGARTIASLVVPVVGVVSMIITYLITILASFAISSMWF